MPRNKNKRGESDSESEDEEMDSKYRSSGIIKEITLVNFQSHKNLKVKFGPNVNFITGQNGSGKSAILMGIKTCLGATAKQTDRASKLDDLIREDTDHATITLILKNEGIDAYAPERYGNEIGIQRDLRRGRGANTYKMLGSRRNARGERMTVSIKNSTIKHELSQILNHFNIQYDNPCVLMTQDVSREYIKNSTDATKYLFFEKATLLAQMQTENTNTGMNQEAMFQSLETGNREVQEAEENLNKIKRTYQDAKTLETLGADITKYRSELSWAYAYKLDLDRKEMETEVESLMSKVPAIEQRIEDRKKKAQDLEASERQKGEEYDQLSAESRGFTAKLQEKRTILDSHKRKAKEHASQNSRKKIKVEQCKTAIRQQEEIVNRAPRDLAGEEAQRQDKLDSLHKHLEELKTKQAQAEQGYSEIQQQEQELKEDVDRLKQRKNPIMREASQLEREIRQMTETNNQLSYYGRDGEAFRVKEAIDRLMNGRKFSRRPMGPLGLHMSFRDEKYQRFANPLNMVVSKLCQSYLVNTNDDMRHLQSVFRRVYGDPKKRPWPQIITSRFSDQP